MKKKKNWFCKSIDQEGNTLTDETKKNCITKYHVNG